MTKLFAAALVALWSLIGTVAQAQDSVNYDAWERLTTRVQTALSDGNASLARLDALREQLVSERAIFEDASQQNAPQIATVEEQIASLGAAPAEGETEDPEIAKRREELNTELAELKAPGLRAQEAQQEATGLIGQIDSTLRNRQTQWALTRGQSPLSLDVWTKAVPAMRDTLASFGATSSAGGQIRFQSLPVALVLFAIAALLIGRGVRFARQLGVFARRVTRSGTGVWSFVVSLTQIALPQIGVWAAIAGLDHLFSLNSATLVLLYSVQIAAFIILGLRWLVGRIFPVGLPPLLPIDPSHAVPLTRWVSLLGIVLSVGSLITAMGTEPGWTEDVVAAWRFPFVVLMALLLWRISRHLRPNPPAEGDSPSLMMRFLNWVSMGLGAASFAAPIMCAVGYNNAGDALIMHSIQTMVLLGLVVVIQRFAADLWALVTRNPKAHEGLIPTLIGFALTVGSLPLLAMTWGARGTDISELWQRFLGGFSVGETKISPSVFMIFAIVFAIGYMATRILQSALRGTVLPKTRLDRGGQNAVVAGLGYVGIFLSALIAINTAGLDLSGLAIVAGALSVGIGFGLQNVVSNFVSGIILLIERPISEGDWVSVGGTEGYVRSISVRSTRIETFERADVIVPNADFVSGAVTNHTRSNTMGRLVLPVGVAYGTDTRKVQQLLLDLARDVPNVMAYPGPYVVFQAFGASTYDLELRVYIHDVNSGLSTRTEINHRIREVFEENDIEIAFMQHDIWIRGDASKASDA